MSDVSMNGHLLDSPPLMIAPLRLAPPRKTEIPPMADRNIPPPPAGNAAPPVNWPTLAVASLFCALAGIAWPALTWMTGGLRPQTQIDLEALRASVLRLEAQQTADRTLLQANASAAERLVTSRLDGMWRPSDYVERDAHLSALDQKVGATRDQVKDIEYAIKDLTAKYQSMTAVPAAGPRR